MTPSRSPSPALQNTNLSVHPWLRWAVQPSTLLILVSYFSSYFHLGSAFKLVLLPIVLYVNWELVSPYIKPGVQNPFGSIFLLSGRIPSSLDENPLYAKTYEDLLFIAYYVVFFSLVRQLIAIKTCRPIARYFGIKRKAKLDRFGEQGYALVYFLVSGIWGYVSVSIHIASTRPLIYISAHYGSIAYLVVSYRVLLDRSVQTCIHFVLVIIHDMGEIDYPHWEMKPELKRYYLMQSSYWCQQLIVTALGLERPRKDYAELVAHHLVTLWLVGLV